MRPHGLLLLVQIHSHPTRAFFSKWDEEHALNNRAGALNLIVPDYGNARWIDQVLTVLDDINIIKIKIIERRLDAARLALMLQALLKYISRLLRALQCRQRVDGVVVVTSRRDLPANLGHMLCIVGPAGSVGSLELSVRMASEPMQRLELQVEPVGVSSSMRERQLSHNHF